MLVLLVNPVHFQLVLYLNTAMQAYYLVLLELLLQIKVLHSQYRALLVDLDLPRMDSDATLEDSPYRIHNFYMNRILFEIHRAMDGSDQI